MSAGGGRPGALWRIGGLGLVWATRGASDPPPSNGYTIRAGKMKLADVTSPELMAERFQLMS